MANLDDAIRIDWHTVHITPRDHPDRPMLLNRLSNHLGMRYEQTGTLSYLEGAILSAQEAVDTIRLDHANKPAYQSNLSINLALRYQKLGLEADLDQAISVGQNALSALAHDHPDRTTHLSNQSRNLHLRYKSARTLADLTQAILFQEEAIGNLHAEHPNRGWHLENLSSQLRAEFERTGVARFLDSALEKGQAAIDATPQDHPYRALYLSTMCDNLHWKYKRTGAMVDLEEAVRVGQEAVDTTPLNHPDRVGRLHNLGNRLISRYERTRELTDLESAIRNSRAAIAETPADELRIATYLDGLGYGLYLRYERTGDTVDLDTAIEFGQQAVNITTQGHGRALYLNNLGNYLGQRYETTKAMTDLESAIEMAREAITINPDQVYRGMLLDNLGNRLSLRHNKAGTKTDLDEAIRIGQEAVDQIPQAHYERSMYLNSIGNRLGLRYERTGEEEDLKKAIQATQEAVTPRDHPHRPLFLNNLGNRLSLKYERTEAMEDLDSAIKVAQEAVDSTPVDQPETALYLSNLGNHFGLRYDRIREPADLENAIATWRQALECSVASPMIRIGAGREAFILLAQNRDWQAARDVSADVIKLVPKLIARSLSKNDHQHLVRNLTNFSSMAATVVLQAGGSAAEALQTLEAGRGVIAGLVMDSDSDINRVQMHQPQLFAEYSKLRQQVSAPLFDFTKRMGEQTQKLRGHDGSVNAVAFSPDGQVVASASYNKMVRLWNAQTSEQTHKLEGHDDAVSAVAFSPDGLPQAVESLISTGPKDSQFADTENAENEQLTQPTTLSDMIEEAQANSKPEDGDQDQDEIQSVASVEEEIQSRQESTKSPEFRETYAYCVVQVLTGDQETKTLYQEVPNRMSNSKFVNNHRRLLKRFYLDATSDARTSSQSLAMRFMRSRPARERISRRIISLCESVNSQEDFGSRLAEGLDKNRDTVAWMDEQLTLQNSDPNMFTSEQAELDTAAEVGTEDDFSGSSEESDAEEQKDSLSNLRNAASFLTEGRPFQVYKSNVRRFIRGELLAPESFQIAISMRDRKRAMTLLKEEPEAVTQDEYKSIRESLDNGLTPAKIVDLIIEEQDQSSRMRQFLPHAEDDTFQQAVNKHDTEEDRLATMQGEQFRSSPQHFDEAHANGKIVEGAFEQHSGNVVTFMTRDDYQGLEGATNPLGVKILLAFVFQVVLFSWVIGFINDAEFFSIVLSLLTQIPWTEIYEAVNAFALKVPALFRETQVKTTPGLLLDPGCSRVFWICICGKTHTRDFDARHSLGALRMYEAFSLAGYSTILQASPARSESQTFQEKHKDQLRVLSDRSCAVTGSRTSPPLDQQAGPRQQRFRGQITTAKEQTAFSRSDHTIQDESSLSEDSDDEKPVSLNTPPKWLLFCFDHRASIPKIEHVRLPNDASDQDLFPRLRKKYYSYKTTRWIKWMGLSRFVAYLTNYEIKNASFVKFRLLPDMRSSKGMPSKLDEWMPDRYWQPSGWDPADIGERPDIDTKWFLCHWAHPEEDWLRFWAAARETYRDAKMGSSKFAASTITMIRACTAQQTLKQLLSRMWLMMTRKSDGPREICDGIDLEQASSSRAGIPLNPDADQRLIIPGENQTLLRCERTDVPLSKFLVKGPKKVRTRLLPSSEKPPHGWGLYVYEERKANGIVFFMVAIFFVLNVSLFGYVIRDKLYSMESMVLSACSLTSGIVLFLSKR